jgi:transcriptional regulator NrdR family protein
MRRRKQFKFFAPLCPKCGSTETRIDWRSTDNYRMGVLTAVMFLFGDLVGRYDRVCSKCHHRFTP